MSSRRFPPFAWGVFGYSLLVILWGYFLRISESGDGCGTDWPLCHGAVVPEAPPFATFVEFSHRISSGLVLLLVLAMVIWALRAYPRGSAVRKAAGASLLFTLTESLVGAVLVVLGWVATDVSLGRIIIRPFHVTNTFLLMAALALTAWWSWRGVTRIPRPSKPTVRLMGPVIVGVLALAWTGSWTGLAATAFPAETLRDGVGQYLDPQHLLIYLRVSHPILALVVIGLVLRMVRIVRDGSTGGVADTVTPVTRRLALACGVLAGVQLLAGPATIALGNPWGMRLGHLFLADLLWVALVLLASEVAGARGAPEAAETADQPWTNEASAESLRTNPARS